MSHRSGSAQSVERLSTAVVEASEGGALVTASGAPDALDAAGLAAGIAAVAVTTIAVGADLDEVTAEIAGEEAAHPTPRARLDRRGRRGETGPVL